MSVSFSMKPLEDKDAEGVDKAFGVKGALLEFYPGKCLLPPYYANIAQQILDAPVREDDIWLLSYPRTGSTWCQEMLWLLGNDLDFETARNTIQQIRAPLIEMSTALIEFQGTLGALVENSVEYINNLPLTPIYQKSFKIIYTCRNPKDMCVSYYFHCKMVHNLQISFEEFADLLIRGLMPIGDVFSHYLTMWNKRHETNILILKYEDMKRDLMGTVKKIATFLGKSYSDEQYDSLCDFLSFNKMRDNRGCNLEVLLEEKNGKGFFQKSGEHFIRKGQIGDWKNHMSPEIVKRFDDWIEENTRGTGLAFD